MCQFKLKICRKNGKRVNPEKLKERLTPIIARATTSLWEAEEYKIDGPFLLKDGHWVYDVIVTFNRNRKTSDTVKTEKEMDDIIASITEAGASTAFAKYPWYVDSSECSWDTTRRLNETDAVVEEEKENDEDVSGIIDFERAIPLEDLNVPDVLINGSDDEIESHPDFAGLFNRAAHIRVIFSSIHTMKVTDGQRRNHGLLYGLPACAKSTLLKGTQKVLGPGGYLSINSNSATKAGIEKIFLHHVKQVGLPPILFIEEIEKTQEAILTTWLSIMDDRGEVRKVNNRTAAYADARVLCFATANDKVLLDRLMGGRPKHPGALSSRFTKKLYVPRPDWETMKRILMRDISLYGGRAEWADKCIEIAKELGTNDPRTVLSLLDGGDRLMNGLYKQDIMKIYSMEKNDYDPEEEELAAA